MYSHLHFLHVELESLLLKDELCHLTVCGPSVWKPLTCTQVHRHCCVLVSSPIHIESVGKGSSLWGTDSSLGWGSQTLPGAPLVSPHAAMTTCFVFGMELFGKRGAVGSWGKGSELALLFPRAIQRAETSSRGMTCIVLWHLRASHPSGHQQFQNNPEGSTLTSEWC